MGIWSEVQRLKDRGSGAEDSEAGSQEAEGPPAEISREATEGSWPGEEGSGGRKGRARDDTRGWRGADPGVEVRRTTTRLCPGRERELYLQTLQGNSSTIPKLKKDHEKRKVEQKRERASTVTHPINKRQRRQIVQSGSSKTSLKTQSDSSNTSLQARSSSSMVSLQAQSASSKAGLKAQSTSSKTSLNADTTKYSQARDDQSG
jgi:hypothetical protein